VLFAAAFSRTGGARVLFLLGETQSIQILVSSGVLSEAEAALRRKAPDALGRLAIWLNRSRCHIVEDAPWSEVEAWNEIVGYLPDAGVVAAAVACKAEYLVTLDRRPSVFDGMDNKRLNQALPLPIGTPGDCLAWLRTALVSPFDDASFDAPSKEGQRLNERLAAYYTQEIR